MKSLGEHWGLEFTPEEIAGARDGNGLLSLELELSHVCNLRCIYCYASAGMPLENELSLDEIKDIIDQAVRLGTRKIVILGGGEPLLYPHLFEVIDYILARGVKADIFTNGQLMTMETARRLYERNVSVALKTNSRNREVQDYLAGQQGAFDNIRQALKALQDAGYPDENHTLGIETIICRQNLGELPDLWRWARNQGIIPYIEIMTLQGRAKEYPDLEVSTEETRILFEELAKIDCEEFGNRWTPHPPLVGSQCARHEYSCTVTAVGEVQPCPGVNVSAGNVREKPLAEIIAKGKPIQELRNIRKNIKGKCSDCDLGFYCYGCRGHAYQVTGDYLAADPLCWIKVDEEGK